MSTHKQVILGDELTDAQVIELAETVRKMWRQEVAAGRMKLDPKRIRAYDKSLAELRQLTGV